MARCYRHRPPYASEVYATLLELVKDTPRHIFDVGCGPGKLARELAPHVDRVDAVDFSPEMLREARRSAGGTDPRIRWVCAPVETSPLDPPYALICAGASIHWMDQEIVLERFAQALAPHARLALVDGDQPLDPPWGDQELSVFAHHLTEQEGSPPFWAARGYRPFELLERPLLQHPRFRLDSVRITTPVEFEQSVEEYLAAVHSRQSFCIEALGAERAAALDADLREVLRPHSEHGRVRYRYATRIEWGSLVPSK